MAYESMWQFAQKGIEQGNFALKKYDENFEDLIKSEIEKIRKSEETKDNPKYSSPYFKKDGSINDTRVNSDREEVFKEGYKAKNRIYTVEIIDKNEYVKGYKAFVLDGIEPIAETNDEDVDISKGSIVRLRNKLKKYKILDKKLNENLDEINLTAEIKNTLAADFTYDKPLEISITSLYKHNSIERKINATYQLIIPHYNVQYSLPTEIVKIPKNPAWSKALMVNGDMKINGGKVNIVDGDIYVKGKDGNSETSGIDLTNKDSKLYSNKNIVTNKNLVLSYTEENKSKNVVIDQNVFCRNLLINETAKGVNLNIKKSLYTLDDLEINAPNSHVEIEDSYYGVSDGSEGERNNPDNSSSIIINTEDIGNRVDENNKKLINNSTLTIGKNLFIAGTSYIDLPNNIKYQTGESISIKGNYRAYTEALSSSNSKFKEGNVIFDYLDPLTLVTKYNKSNIANDDLVQATIENKRYITVYLTPKGQLAYNNATKFSILYNGKESKKLNIAKQGQSIYNEKIDTLKLYNKEYIENITILLYDSTSPSNKIATIEKVPLISNTELNAFDKSEYFKAYYNQFTKDSGLNLGEGITINKDAQVIHSGSIFKTGNNDNPISEGSWNGEKDNEIKAKSIQLKNQLFYMGRMIDYEDLNSVSIDELTGANILVNDKFYDLDLETEPVVTIDTNVKFEQLTSTEKASNGQLILLDKDVNTYLIQGKGMTEEEIKTIKDKNQNSKIVDISKDTSTSGVIIAKGNIIIAGEVNFTGTIICDGNITFEGTGDKNITYNKAYLENFAINNHELFKSAFEDVGKNAQNDESNYLFAKVYNNIKNSGSSEPNKQLIKRTKWKLVK
ncbi:hypothetical protein Ctaglu_38980 [Clostridium tagluense]|uniref:Uncharacterized protein n=1 Tax=Clostridium tagluense TaxID=360422 RepID=A0A401URW0_9CLOT|nr:hypothetical protein Ctaglu_38980 [Clostridium tagluense]